MTSLRLNGIRLSIQLELLSGPNKVTLYIKLKELMLKVILRFKGDTITSILCDKC